MDRRYRKKMMRYWEKERKKSLLEINSLDLESWFDYWHFHPDWYSKGNKSNETKLWVSKITYVFLNHIEELTKNEDKRLQVWSTICENTGDNAVYIHSANPNGTPYPYDYHNVVWNDDIPSELQDIVDLNKHKIGKAVYDDGDAVYYIKKA